jgi:hypothetical protein
MHHPARIRAAWLGIGLWFGAASAWAIDDRFDPARTEKGGFAPVNNAAYAKECGSCHFTYLPGMLPARSWKALLGARDHFGETLGLKPEVAAEIEQYLVAQAADHTDYRGSELMLSELMDAAVPTRITTLPLMRHRHVVVRKLVADPKAFTNCDTCHENASSGSFAYDHIVVPGVTRVIKPGSMF